MSFPAKIFAGCYRSTGSSRSGSAEATLSCRSVMLTERSPFRCLCMTKSGLERFSQSSGSPVCPDQSSKSIDDFTRRCNVALLRRRSYVVRILEGAPVRSAPGDMRLIVLCLKCENTNGLLRQYFPRGTELSSYSQADLNRIALRLNQRPRKTLGFETPADRLRAVLR